MAKRLWYIITWPSAILATVFAIWLIILQPIWLEQGWMHVKLTFVLLLFIYHYKTHIYFKQLQQEKIKVTSNFMRIWNEGATFILFAVVFLAILKNSINWIYGILGIFILGVLIMLGFRLYKNIRAKNPEA
jgi:putative membrane protein